MGNVTVIRWVGAEPPGEPELIGRLRAAGLSPTGWGNGPGDGYGRHTHEYNKILYCLRGSIVFHTDHGEVALGPGDVGGVCAGTAHWATVGPDGVGCLEAAVAISPAARPG